MKTAALFGILLAASGPRPVAAQGNAVIIPRRPDVRAAATALAKSTGAMVVVDPSLSGTVNPSALALPLEEALTEIASLRHARWCKVFLKDVAATPDAKTLTRTARVLQAVDMDGVAVEDVSTGKASFVRWSRTSPGQMPSPGFGRKPVYVLYRNRASDGDDVDGEFADSQQTQLELMRQLSPDQRSNPMMDGMRAWTAMPRTQMEQFMGRVEQASMQIWESTPPERRHDMIEQSVHVMKNYGPANQATADTGDASGAVTAPPPGNYTGDLTAVASELGRRYKVKVVVDPALFLIEKPQAPGGGKTLVAALDELTQGMPGVGWRRAYLPRAHTGSSFSAAKLARVVGSLCRAEMPEAGVEDAAGGRRVTNELKDASAKDFIAGLAAAGFAAEPVYVIFARLDTGGVSPQDRYAEIQNRQIELMTRMSADQLQDAMAGAMRMSGDGNSEDAVGLPIIAGMMATWMPREAKENHPPLGR